LPRRFITFRHPRSSWPCCSNACVIVPVPLGGHGGWGGISHPRTAGGPGRRAARCRQRGQAASPAGRAALHANQAVPTGRLIELLWGGQPPPKAKVTLQNYVVRLRRLHDVATARTGDPVPVTQPPGYLVRAGPDELDLLSFERLVAEGWQARAAGDVEHAASLLRSALALWRGSALADVDAEPLQHSEAARLEERRLAAVDDWVEAELLLGRHQHLVAELRARGHAPDARAPPVAAHAGSVPVGPPSRRPAGLPGRPAGGGGGGGGGGGRASAWNRAASSSACSRRS